MHSIRKLAGAAVKRHESFGMAVKRALGLRACAGVQSNNPVSSSG